MRVIAGSLSGRKIEAPRSDSVRPTYDRVRESVFAIIEPRLYDASVLDLFAGTGSLAIEALSRGARRATMVEIDRGTARVAAANVERLGLAGRCRLRVGEAIQFLAGPFEEAPFDIAFVDPPYQSGLVGPALDALVRVEGTLSASSVVVVERSVERGRAEARRGLELARTERYGSTAVDFYERSVGDAAATGSAPRTPSRKEAE